MNQKLKKLNNKKIAVLGLGLENYALIKFLLNQKINCAITVFDYRAPKFLGARYQALRKRRHISFKLGGAAKSDLDGFDILFRSPGWPLFDEYIKKAREMKVEVTSSLNLFFQLCPSKNIIGVTGTKGKGTTASLIFKILQAGRKRAWLGGNIGVAPFSFLNKIKKNDWVILELSSFQLEDLKYSPRIAVITNFNPEHLKPADPHNPNFHKNLEDYWQAKLNIIRAQKADDFAVINKKLEEKMGENAEVGRGERIYFTISDWPSRLLGEHNKENIAAAAAVAKIIRLPEARVKEAVARFKGLPHRLEFVGKKSGISYYDDSFATTPDSAITAINSFFGPIILLAGGADKGSNFKKLVGKIKRKVKFIVLFKGSASPRLRRELIKGGFPAGRIKSAGSMREAIKLARKKAIPGDTILLSPACASFGIFKNYKERGNEFKKLVK